MPALTIKPPPNPSQTPSTPSQPTTAATAATRTNPLQQPLPQQPPTQNQQEPAQQQPSQTPPRSSSPPRPPISPITPTLGPIRLDSAGTTPITLPPRQTFTHAQPNQTGIPPPAPRPIPFDDNPDAIALKSAIAVLQVQRRKAAEDITRLHRAKEDALRDTDAFVRDLAEGRVRASEGGLGLQAGVPDDPLESESDSSDEDGEGEGKGPDIKMEEVPPGPRKVKAERDASKKAWHSLPARQNVVRCPPINWNQYAVVGESLDKMHAEQLSAPSQGAPATVGQGGMYEFKGGEGKKEKLVGIAAPYTPGRDKLPDRKSKGPKR